MELPEVEVMRRDLDRDVIGKKIKTAEVKGTKNAMRAIRRHKTRKEFTSRLAGHKITKTERRGKYILLHLDDGDVWVVHFGMSGRFQRGNGRLAVAPHTHVIATFQQGGDLRFIDPRTFGEVFVASPDEMGKIKDLQHIAIDPLDQVFTWPTFQYLLAEKAAKMKQLLMDQKFISGLGNIYSDEVLFGAGLRFDRLSNTLSSQEVRRLYRSMQEVLQEAIKLRGTTLGRRGLPRSVRRARRIPERAEGLRAHRVAVPAMPHADPDREDLPAQFVLLPAVPELKEVRDGCRRRESIHTGGACDDLVALGAAHLGRLDSLQHRHPDGRHWLEIGHFPTRSWPGDRRRRSSPPTTDPRRTSGCASRSFPPTDRLRRSR